MMVSTPYVRFQSLKHTPVNCKMSIHAANRLYCLCRTLKFSHQCSIIRISIYRPQRFALLLWMRTQNLQNPLNLITDGP